MAGALSFMAAGAAQGLGQGIAAYGQTMARDDLQNQRLNDRLQLERERASLRTQGAGRSGAASPAQKLTELSEALMSGKLTGALVGGGMDAGRARDFTGMAQGNRPMVDNPEYGPVQEGDAPLPERTAKYSEGQGAQLMSEGFKSLRRAMGIVNPEAADNIAKAEGQEQTNELVGKYVGGDTASGRGALVAQGKAPFNEDGDVLTGEAKPGTVAGSIVKSNEANAVARGALAEKYDSEADLRERTDPNAPRRGSGNSTETRSRQLTAERGVIDKEITSAKDTISGLNKQISNGVSKAQRVKMEAEIDEQRAIIKAAQKRYAELGTVAVNDIKSDAAPQQGALSSAPRPKIDQNGHNTQAGETKVAPAVQAERDKDRVAILKRELASATDPADRAAITRELERAGVKVSAAAPEAKPAAAKVEPPAAPRDASARKVGTTYMTPKGALVWMGNGWKQA